MQRVGPYPVAAAPSVESITGSLFANCKQPREALLQALVEVQIRYGWISPGHLQALSQSSGVSVGEIRGIVEFYHFLSLDTPPPYRIYLSTNIIDRWQREGLDFSGLQNNENADVRETSCIGMCDQRATIAVNGFPLTHITQARVTEINKLVAGKVPLSQWPEQWFTVHDTLRVKGALLNHQFKPGDVLSRVRKQGRDSFLKTLQASGLRGRGGAGFSTFYKWKACIEAGGTTKYIVCNADEGEPGTFKDRVLLSDYFANVVEGMCIAAWMSGARQGFIYLRYEYLYLREKMQAALCEWRKAGKPGLEDFDIQIVLGAGAYICGEESALLESMEGKRGIPRIRPPFPVTHGLFGKPTIVNNVETFCNIAFLADDGLQVFAGSGNENSRGSKIHSVAGDCASAGLYEYPLGTSIATILQACGGADAQAVQIGGPSGKLVPRAGFDTPIDFDHVSSGGSFMVFGPQRDLRLVVQNFLHFFRDETCGFCTPCRVGTQVLSQHFDRLCDGLESQHEWELMNDTAGIMKSASHCGLGQTAANPFFTWRDANVTASEIASRPDFIPLFDLADATSTARALREEAHEN